MLFRSSKCRNAAISEAFYYIGIIEAWGTGLGRIRKSCREYGLKEPVIEEFGDGFRVIFFRKIEKETGKKKEVAPIKATKPPENPTRWMGRLLKGFARS